MTTLNAHTPDRYKAAPLMTADTWRISDTRTGEIVSVVKGKAAVGRRLAQLNGEEALRRASPPPAELYD
ncbi:MAG: hypothetical protein HQ481_16880 [Alphaproteobacteria bacterium]|nr:hypothetical protein [Alphaproteobacteria bacterium]